MHIIKHPKEFCYKQKKSHSIDRRALFWYNARMIDRLPRRPAPEVPIHKEDAPGERLLRRHGVVTIEKLTQGNIPHRDNMTPGTYPSYEKLAQQPLHLFSTGEEDKKEFIVVGPALTAEDTSSLLYFAAPYKSFGFDTDDIIMDWRDLYRDTPAQRGRRKAHSTMPGWAQFEASKDPIYKQITDNYTGYSFSDQKPHDILVPVLRWKDTEDGRRIQLEPWEPSMRTAVAGLLPEPLQDVSCFNEGMGLMYLAAYSPLHTEWEDRASYHKGGLTQLISPTQVLAYAYRKVAEAQANPTRTLASHDPQMSPLLPSMEAFMATHEEPVRPVTAGERTDHTAEPFIHQPGGTSAIDIFAATVFTTALTRNGKK